MTSPNNIARNIVAGACAAVLLVIAAGCGSDSTDGRFALSGTVAFEGTPLDQGSIEFVSEDGSQQTGATIANGEFTIPSPQGLPPGTYIVRVFSTEDADPGFAPEAPGPESATAAGKERIPPEFNVNSTLTIEVTEDGDNEFDIKIP